MHVLPQWTNKHLLSPQIDDKWEEPKIVPHLTTLVKRVTELRQVGLQACHYAEKFTLWWIHSFGRWEKLTYECSRPVDLTR
jgi:hypothetical protein